MCFLKAIWLMQYSNPIPISVQMNIMAKLDWLGNMLQFLNLNQGHFWRGFPYYSPPFAVRTWQFVCGKKNAGSSVARCCPFLKAQDFNLHPAHQVCCFFLGILWLMRPRYWNLLASSRLLRCWRELRWHNQAHQHGVASFASLYLFLGVAGNSSPPKCVPCNDTGCPNSQKVCRSKMYHPCKKLT